MKFKNNFTKKHLRIFIGLWIFFSILTFLFTSEGFNPYNRQNRNVIGATIGTILGPMTGAISRHFQSCCLKASLTILLFALPILIITILSQLIKWPDKKYTKKVQIIIWSFGIFIWFFSGIISFLHALS